MSLLGKIKVLDLTTLTEIYPEAFLALYL